jgi:hypothetical protein
MKHEELREKITGTTQSGLYELKSGLDGKLYENARLACRALKKGLAPGALQE